MVKPPRHFRSIPLRLPGRSPSLLCRHLIFHGQPNVQTPSTMSWRPGFFLFLSCLACNPSMHHAACPLECHPPLSLVATPSQSLMTTVLIVTYPGLALSSSSSSLYSSCSFSPSSSSSFSSLPPPASPPFAPPPSLLIPLLFFLLFLLLFLSSSSYPSCSSSGPSSSSFSAWQAKPEPSRRL